tara:strand:+ start:7711 stop:8637 length:927 start_codon:yes stop_codon:yes gene_type:complete
LKKKILLTGYPGWLASELFEFFKNDFEIITLGLDQPSRNNKNHISLNLKHFNQAELIKYKKIDYLIHCAGVIHPINNKDFYKINYEGSKKLIENLYYFEKIIFISSNAVYKRQLNRNLQVEERANPTSEYGKSKKLFEDYLLKYHREKTFILRPSTFHFKRYPKKYDDYINFIVRYCSLLPKKEIFRDFTSLELLIDIIAQCIKFKKKPGIYNVCDAAKVSLFEFHDIIEEKLQIKLRKIYLKQNIINFFFILDKYLSLLNIYQKEIHLLGESNWETNMCRQKLTKEFTIRNYIDLRQNLSSYLKNDY